MNEKDLELLEFQKIREILAGFTSFSASQALALQLQPSSNYDLISQQLGQSAEAQRLLSLQPEFSIKEASDISEVAHLAARGKIIDPQDMIKVQDTLAATHYIRANLRQRAEELPLLWDIADQIIEMPHLKEHISKSISGKGEILDSASTLLSYLRVESKDLRQQLLGRLESIIASPNGQSCIQEDFVTEREGRYVIPLKIESRTEIKGIVHDISNTGATAFVEPWATVEMGNRIREITAEEKREIERILTNISNEIGASEADLSNNVNLIAELDLALAKARYAKKANAVEPKVGLIGGNNNLKLDNARHPLLTEKATPLSLEIGKDYSILVITGPNTGGKTVALKTAGLLTLMTQSGMPIPASEKTFIPIFDGIFTDIGDEQSIEQTLSTFSWHMSNIVRILQSSGKRSLVLLDELCTSTDPKEGAALAQAILLHCLSKETKVIATTHYSELKFSAHATPGMQNASLDFDPVTLAPTYHLTMGIPGGSNALAIASQLGLPPDIIASAQGNLNQSTQHIEALLADLQKEKQDITSLRKSLDRNNKTAEEIKVHLESELQKLKVKEQNILREMRDKLTEETVELQREIRRTTSELKKTRSRENLAQAQKAQKTSQDQSDRLDSQLKTSQVEIPSEPAATGKIGIDDKVWLPDMEMWGTVLSLREEDRHIEVQVGHAKLSMRLERVCKPEQPTEIASPKPPFVRLKATMTASLELDLRGKRADAVSPELDRYLNDASIAHLTQVRIIHGFGTGTVRQIVRDMLATHPLVKSFRQGEQNEGGDGVTMATL